MKPTQAQIEAAAKEIRAMLATIGNPTPENLAYAALAAAAEVGEPSRQQLLEMITRLHDDAEILEAKTIERCAQKCDELARAAEADSDDEEINARTDAFAEASAAIRALKNQP